MLFGLINGLSILGSDLLATLLRPFAQSFGQIAYYVLISNYIRNEIDKFGLATVARMSTLAGVVAFSLVFIWIFFQGLRILSGKGDSMMVLVTNGLRVTLIVAAATAMGVAGSDIYKVLHESIPKVIGYAITGTSTTVEDQIDGNLAAMQIALSSIDAVNVVQDPTLQDDKKTAMLMTGFGTAGPAMIGGALLLMYQMALAMFIAFGPIFILCLIFDQTRSMFSRWLMYGISTMFSMSVLAVVVSIAAKTVIAVAGAFWATTTLGALTGLSLNQGLSTMSLQQGGVGLLLSGLILGTPPMAGNFFSASLGQFAASSQFGASAPKNIDSRLTQQNQSNQPTQNTAPNNQTSGTTSSGYGSQAQGQQSVNQAVRPFGTANAQQSSIAPGSKGQYNQQNSLASTGSNTQGGTPYSKVTTKDGNARPTNLDADKG